MKILVISDTHGDNITPKEILLRHKDIDIYLHAGDSESLADFLTPYRTVKGNCDHFDQTMLDHLKIKTPYGLLYMKHYPYLTKEERDLNIKIFIHGHTHKRQNEIHDDIYYLCPGSLSYPRDNNVGTYMILDIQEDEVKVTFYEV